MLGRIVDFFRGRKAQSGEQPSPPQPDSFLADVTGIIHVGANIGQERKLYQSHGLCVVWVEPIPETFAKLTENIREFPRQRALQYLLTDQDGQSFDFKIASNNGASSSILELGLHKEIWPKVHYVDTIKLTSTTLATMVKKEGLDINDYQALVMDTQGSELMVLKGAEDLLPNFRYIKTEAPDFESYVGCCLADDLTAYLAGFGFRELHRQKFAERKEGGSYYDILYGRE